MKPQVVKPQVEIVIDGIPLMVDEKFVKSLEEKELKPKNSKRFKVTFHRGEICAISLPSEELICNNNYGGAVKFVNGQKVYVCREYANGETYVYNLLSKSKEDIALKHKKDCAFISTDFLRR